MSVHSMAMSRRSHRASAGQPAVPPQLTEAQKMAESLFETSSVMELKEVMPCSTASDVHSCKVAACG